MGHDVEFGDVRFLAHLTGSSTWTEGNYSDGTHHYTTSYYELTPLRLHRPRRGATVRTVTCPTCREPLTYTVYSPTRTLLLRALGCARGGAVIACLVASWVYSVFAIAVRHAGSRSGLAQNLLVFGVPILALCVLGPIGVILIASACRDDGVRLAAGRARHNGTKVHSLRRTANTVVTTRSGGSPPGGYW